MNKTKIEWADFTWNPVWGCRNACPYCYARKLAHRWGKSFEPHLVEKNFQREMPGKPSWIFVNSMSDVAYWDSQWWEIVLTRIADYPEHSFLFLTKSPTVYERWDFPKNCWLGVTITCGTDMDGLADDLFVTSWDERHPVFLSIEPLLGPIPHYVDANWIIIGAETGNRKGKVVPKREWIEQIVGWGRPVFMKDSLIPIWGKELIRQWPT